METSKSFEELKKQLKLYIESKLELYRLEALDHSTYILSYVLGLVILIAIFLLFLLSLGLFLGFWLGELLESNWLGFAIISAFYLLVMLLIALRFKKMIQVPLQNLLINKIDHYYEEKGE